MGGIQKQDRGLSRGASTILTISLIVMLMLGVGLAFLAKSVNLSSFAGLFRDHSESELAVDYAHSLAMARFDRMISGVSLEGKLSFAGGPEAETFANLANTYAVSSTTALDFLHAIVETQAMDDDGNVDTSSEFADFDSAFPTTWTDPDPSDSVYIQNKYSFTAMTPLVSLGEISSIKFEYEYKVESQGYGGERYSKVSGTDSGVITIDIQGTPFSSYALFRATNTNQNGWTLVFSGGNSASEVREIFNGPVHLNDTPYFYGAPRFLGAFSSTAASSAWWQGTATNYSGSAVFSSTHTGAVQSISMPTSLFNTVRLAAGDPSPTAATDATSTSTSDLVSFMGTHALGTLSSSTIPDGVYIPISDTTYKWATGGVYIQGDAAISLNVVSGASDFGSYWANIDSDNRSCSFQKIRVDHVTSGVATRDIFVGSGTCEVTYIFSADSPSSSPAKINGRTNGNIFVVGQITALGGESRSRPSVATDFGFNISAYGQIKINNDIQYEDAQYVAVNSDLSLGTSVVALPTGETGGSGISNTDTNVSPMISQDSKTVLGITSLYRSVIIDTSAPSNLNLHAAIYAGNSNAYNSGTGYGCGTAGASTAGCGLGYESWNTVTGKGSLKFLGSLSEYKSQSIGETITPFTGYQRRLVFDTRFANGLSPPGYPTTATPRAVASRHPIKTWRLAGNP